MNGKREKVCYIEIIIIVCGNSNNNFNIFSKNIQTKKEIEKRVKVTDHVVFEATKLHCMQRNLEAQAVVISSRLLNLIIIVGED